MIRMSLRLPTDTHQTQAITEALRSLMRPARSEASCIRCELLADTQSPEVLLYIEEWIVTSDRERQISSPRFGVLLLLMEEACGRPELKFALVGETRGLEYVEAVREGQPVKTWPVASAVRDGRSHSEEEARVGEEC